MQAVARLNRGSHRQASVQLGRIQAERAGGRGVAVWVGWSLA